LKRAAAGALESPMAALCVQSDWHHVSLLQPSKASSLPLHQPPTPPPPSGNDGGSTVHDGSCMFGVSVGVVVLGREKCPFCCMLCMLCPHAACHMLHACSLTACTHSPSPPGTHSILTPTREPGGTSLLSPTRTLSTLAHADAAMKVGCMGAWGLACMGLHGCMQHAFKSLLLHAFKAT